MGLVPLARAPETAKFVPTGNPTKCSDGSTSKPILFASTSTARGPLLNPLSKGGLLRNPNSGREARLPVSDRLSPNTKISLKEGSAVLPNGNRSQMISSELGEACAERVLQSIQGRERLVGQGLLPQFFPDRLGWIEFRTAGRLGQ